MNIKKIIYENRLILIDNKLYIEDFKKLEDITENMITTIDYVITGSSLKVNKIDKHLLVITGSIEQIRRKKNEHLQSNNEKK